MSQEPDTAPDESTSAPVTADRKGLHSRRALVAGVVGAGVGAAAAMVAAAPPASAADGGNVILGTENSASTTTTILTTGGIGLLALSRDSGGGGILGADLSGGSGFGVIGDSSHGIGARGSSLNGTGVEGTCPNGTGVQATSSTGTALAVTGKVTFSNSGTATVAEGQDSVTVSQSGVSPSSLTLATLQQVQGSAAVAAAVPGTDSFTIFLTSKAKAPLPVAWFVIG